MRKLLFITALLIAAAIINGCSKAPDGVINEDDMAHVLADFAKAEMLIEQNPDMFRDDSTKLLLKQSILKKYDADMAMYDSSIVWYAHNLKVYAQVHDKAIELLEKESNNGKPVHTASPDGNYMPEENSPRVRRTFPTSGDSANVWKEPQQWVLTNAMRNGYIQFDYKPDNDSRKGDKYALCFKMINSGNTLSMLVAIDYQDGCTSYISRSAQANGWIENTIQSDTARDIKRIYGFIRFKTRPLGITFIDSTYLLRTHLDPSNYATISQRIVGPKAIIEQMQAKQIQVEQNTSPTAPSSTVEQPLPRPSLPSEPQRGISPVNNTKPSRHVSPTPGTYTPKPGLHKSSRPTRDILPNPNRATR